MRDFTPSDWFWVADDGRVYSSASRSIVPADDPTLASFKEDGNYPSRWPFDETGAQTQESLQEVLSEHGLSYDSKTGLLAYAASVRYNTEVGGVTVSGMRVATDDRSKTMIIGTRIAAQSDPTFTTPWVSPDGTTRVLSSDEVVALSNAVLAHVQACFQAFEQVATQVASGKVTTTTQVDAIFAQVT